MAQQREVVGPRRFMSHQWYRKIGEHNYRFRYTPRPDWGAVEIIADRALARRQWERVHQLIIETGEGS